MVTYRLIYCYCTSLAESSAVVVTMLTRHLVLVQGLSVIYLVIPLFFFSFFFSSWKVLRAQTKDNNFVSKETAADEV